MAIIYECDLCGANLPTEKSFQPIVIAEEKIAESCLNCASELKQAIIKKKSDIVRLKMEALKNPPAPEVPPEPSPPPEPEAPSSAMDAPEGKEAESGQDN